APAGRTAGASGLGGGSTRGREAAVDAVWHGELRANVLPPSRGEAVCVPGGRDHRRHTPPAGQCRGQSAAGGAGCGAIVSQERPVDGGGSVACLGADGDDSPEANPCPRRAESADNEAASEVPVRRGGRRSCAQTARGTLAAAVGVRA